MYSPADLPSSKRAAPAKKRKLSEQTGSSSFAYASGLPTFSDSTSASSSVCSSIASASLSSISARSPGVVSSHSGSAFLAAFRDLGDLLARGRIDHLLDVALDGVHPFPSDDVLLTRNRDAHHSSIRQ